LENKPKAMVFVDASNYHYGLNKLGWKVDYQKFLKWLNDRNSAVTVFYYGSIHSEKSFFDSHPEYQKHPQATKIQILKKYREDANKFFKKLKSFGIIVREKEVSSIYDNTEGRYKLKCNCDVELTVDAMDKIGDYKEIILCSGDGDFARLLRYLKNKGKIATVISIQERTSFALHKAANNIIYLNKLKPLIEFAP
jgi:uncharacterized LabA/DUF88 family protein